MPVTPTLLRSIIQRRFGAIRCDDIVTDGNANISWVLDTFHPCTPLCCCDESRYLLQTTGLDQRIYSISSDLALDESIVIVKLATPDLGTVPITTTTEPVITVAYTPTL